MTIENPTMTDSLLKILALAPGPQTASELLDGLRRSGIKVDEFQVLQELRRLQGVNIVRIEGTRWRLLTLPQGISLAPNQPAPKTAPANSTQPKSTAIPTPIMVPPPAPAGRWALFRRFCHYYMDCLLQEEAPQLRCYVNNQNDTWITASDVPWGRLGAGAGFAVPLSRDQAAFQRNRVKRGEEECVYLCYPLVLYQPKDKEISRFVVPLFAQPMQADWRAGVLHLEPDGPIAVNGAWLEYAFRQRNEREAFLRAMGFLNEVGDGDEDTGEAKTTGPVDYASLAVNAAHYIHRTDRPAENINPMQLGLPPEWDSAQPGLFNAAILTLGPRLKYTRSLLRDLRDISEKFSDEELDQTALAALFPHEPAPPPPPPTSELVMETAPPASGGNDEINKPVLADTDLAQNRLLHPCQRAAVTNSLAEKISIVTGPPGTGKSEVVSVMLLNHLLRGRPALFASKNHQALDAVLPRLNRAVEGGDLIIQTVSRELAQRQNYLGKLQSLLARPPRPDAARGEEFQRQFADLFARQHSALSEITATATSGEEYERANQLLEDARKKLPLHLQADVAITRWPDSMPSANLLSAQKELHAVLAPAAHLLARLWRWLRRREFAARQATVFVVLVNLPSPFADRPLPDSQSHLTAWDELFAVWQNWAEAARLLALVRDCEQAIARLPSAEECNQRLTLAQKQLEKLTQDWMTWAGGGLPNVISPTDRQALANLRAGIQNWGVDRFAKELREHFPLVLNAFPLWSVSNLSARSAIPLLPALYDLVIVDEASQCDIASVIPLLARSRQAVFAGDPMQLRHISTLDVAVEQTLLTQHGLTDSQLQRFTYRVNSAFEFADSSASIPAHARVRLDLHFRSHNLIADYCNDAFYSNTLSVVTLTERLNIPAGMQPGIHWTQVAGKIEAGITGSWCADEITRICQELQSLAATGYQGTIGVVTPFRQQMIRLRDALDSNDAIPRDFMERVHFLAATAHGFQGDERDLILFSLCGGPDMPDGSTIFLRENPNLFNVAVSRARAVLHVIGNRDWALISGVKFIEKLARRTLSGSHPDRENTSEIYQSPWEKKLAMALTSAGIKVIPQHPAAGRFLDLAVLGPVKIDIEVDGESVHRTAGGGRKDDDHWRDLQLQSLGWKVRRFWVYELREDMTKCVDQIKNLLK